ncbi:MAG: hypothetical protein QM234_04270 [Acidobacteriota bacterium]|jgi:hypothetical protein|nr:hypothetical protein [Acidobacteriota bacterium]
MKAALYIVAVLILSVGLVACSSSSKQMVMGPDGKPVEVPDQSANIAEWVEFCQAMNLDAEGVIVYGTGHIGGQAFNLTGSNGYLRISVHAAPREAIAPEEPAE